MRKTLFILALIGVVGVQGAQARDVEHNLSIAEFMADAEVRQKLGSDVTFYFSGQPTPPVAKSFGDVVTNRKTNSFGKPDASACRWAMLSALIHLRDRAKELGGNAVVNIVSYYKKDTQASSTHLRMPRGKHRGWCGAEGHCGRGRNRGSARQSTR